MLQDIIGEDSMETIEKNTSNNGKIEQPVQLYQPPKDWKELTKVESYMLDMAEFKGAVIEALKELKYHDDQHDKEHAAFRTMLSKNNLIAGVIGAIGAILVLTVTVISRMI